MITLVLLPYYVIQLLQWLITDVVKRKTENNLVHKADAKAKHLLKWIKQTGTCSNPQIKPHYHSIYKDFAILCSPKFEKSWEENSS